VVRAARERGVPTVYLQHASVTDQFPPLAFDYALLEGADALHKYAQTGPSSAKVFLVGMAKSDGYCRHLNNSPAVRTLGICLNIHDPVERMQTLCDQVCREFPDLRVWLRPHPGDKRVAAWVDLARQHGMEFSDSRAELSFGFLSRVDAVVAGNSNILLEAALMNVFPLYFDSYQSNRDWYGFERNGLVEFLPEAEDVCRLLKDLCRHKPPVRHRARIYCATIGTQYDGQSSGLIGNIVGQVASTGTVGLAGWRRIQGTELEAYEPVAETEPPPQK